MNFHIYINDEQYATIRAPSAWAAEVEAKRLFKRGTKIAVHPVPPEEDDESSADTLADYVDLRVAGPLDAEEFGRCASLALPLHYHDDFLKGFNQP